MYRLTTLAALLSLFLAGCASTGGGSASNEALCALAGALIGGAGAAATADEEGATAAGAAIGAGLGYLACQEREPEPPPADVDTDGDGVYDRLDACPGTLPGVEVDARGCPMDSDGDGVWDGLDRCPGTPRGAPVDEFGCEFDGDGDGVVDSRDQCPGTLAGVEVDERGCPLAGELLMRLEGVNFEFDAAAITPTGRTRLDRAIAVLRDVPDVRIRAEGHTDSVGSAAYNQGLSQRRARAVVDYLVAGGIARSRLEAAGFGEDRPLVDNDTKANRARNRRVELVVIE